MGAATSPHELKAARAEIPLGIVEQKAVSETVGKGAGKGGKKEDEEKKKQICYCWKNCETRGKCKLEVENEGEKSAHGSNPRTTNL